MIRALLLILLLVLPAAIPGPASAQAGRDSVASPSGTISVRNDAATDLAIRNRIYSILDQVASFDSVRARVDAGIVTLTGEATEQATIDRLNALIARVDGVVAIEDQVLLSTDIGLRLESVRGRFLQRLNQVAAGLPFVVLGLLVGAVIVLLGCRGATRRWHGSRPTRSSPTSWPRPSASAHGSSRWSSRWG